MITKEELLAIAQEAYYPENNTIINIFRHCVRGDRDPEEFGDTLATFIVRELLDTYHPDSGDESNLTDSIEALERAAKELNVVADRLTDHIKHLNERRITATILAALRHWQDTIHVTSSSAKQILPEHFEDVEPLSVEEIDTLCEELSCSSEMLFDSQL